MVSRVDTPCNMECVKYCFQDNTDRFENVQDIKQLCLIPTCNCTNGDISYTTVMESNK